MSDTNAEARSPAERRAQPPRGTRLMAVVRWGLLGAVTTLAVTTIWHEWGPGASDSARAEESRFYCPMHPQIRSSSPGDCPICHMRLVPIPRERRSGTGTGARAPRGAPTATQGHPDQDAGVAATGAASARESPAAPPARPTPRRRGARRGGAAAGPTATTPPETLYTCPMDPEVRSPTPGRCPVCGMNLVRQAPPTASPDVVYTCPMHPEVRSPTPGRCPICGMDLVRRQASALTAPPGLVEIMVTLERRQESGIVTVPVTRGAGSTELRAPAIVEVREDAVSEVHVRAPAFVERVSVLRTGERVRRGQTLAWVYSPEIHQAARELAATARWSTSPELPAGDMGLLARERLRNLGVSPGEIGAIAGGRAPSGRVALRAPRAGTVVSRAALPGGYAMPETVLYEIADLSRVWAVASVLDRDVAQVTGALGAVFLPRDGGPPLEARVELVEPRTDADSRTTRARLALSNTAGRLRPGQLGDVSFRLAASTALTVPRDAVMDTGEHRYVFVEHGDGVFEPRAVRLGAIVEERWEVLEGLSEAERVASRGAFLLDAESRLAAALAEAPADVSHPHGSAPAQTP